MIVFEYHDVYRWIATLGLRGPVHDSVAYDARVRAYDALYAGLDDGHDPTSHVSSDALKAVREILTDGGWLEQNDGTWIPPNPAPERDVGGGYIALLPYTRT